MVAELWSQEGCEVLRSQITRKLCATYARLDLELVEVVSLGASIEVERALQFWGCRIHMLHHRTATLGPFVIARI